MTQSFFKMSKTSTATGVLLLQLLLLFLVNFEFTSGFGLTFFKLKQKHLEDQQNKYLESLKHRNSVMPFGSVREKQILTDYLTQPLDHFNPQNTATYRQRFFVNDIFWTTPRTGPVFLYIGGEGTLFSGVVGGGAIAEFAQRYGALMVAVEHRFYGESINPDGLKIENLPYLSSQQALADLASFHNHISRTYNLTDANKWICFGGSYPGALSAWFRIKYPHLVNGAVASSAPVKAVVNFEGYNDVVNASLSNFIVGGSENCSRSVQLAFDVVDDMMNAGNWSQLSDAFNSCKPISAGLDSYMLASNLADYFMEAVQYNGFGPSSQVGQICQIMTQSADYFKNLVQLMHTRLGMSCMDNSWKDNLAQLSNVTVAGNSAVRQWTYQTCAQFGYFQTCDDDSCLFSRHMTLAPNFEICRAIYNISAKQVYDQITFTNDYYGSNTPRGSDIIFVNGLIDPWHALSVLKDLEHEEIAIVIPGTSHCSDMGADSPSDPSALRAARQKISDTIGVWLSESVRRQAKLSIHRSRFTRL